MDETGFVLTDTLVHAAARLVDDYVSPRNPTHSDLEAWIRRAGLGAGDPHADPAQRVGKEKRVRETLLWALDNDPAAGASAVVSFINLVRAQGGFRPDSPNYCQSDPIESLIAAFAGEPVELTTDGVLRPRRLEGLSTREITEVLRSYVDRARRGMEDSVLLVGTDKDLMEAVAGHVLTERFGGYSEQLDFPTLLGQAFVAVGLEALRPKQEVGGMTGASTALSTSIYELGCAINRLRNKGGSGHGRPFLTSLSDSQVRAATEGAGLVAGFLLDALSS
jgi:hypothetical protein